MTVAIFKPYMSLTHSPSQVQNSVQRNSCGFIWELNHLTVGFSENIYVWHIIFGIINSMTRRRNILLKIKVILWLLFKVTEIFSPVSIFKRILLWSHSADLSHISYQASLSQVDKVWSGGLCHMTKMATRPIHGKNPSEIFSRTKRPVSDRENLFMAFGTRAHYSLFKWWRYGWPWSNSWLSQLWDAMLLYEKMLKQWISQKLFKYQVLYLMYVWLTTLLDEDFMLGKVKDILWP